jgi:hypothetical protein
MAASPGKIYTDILRNDFCAFNHRAFLELNPHGRFEPNWHLEVLAAKLEEVRSGRCKRLILNVPPRLLKSHTGSIAFPAWLLILLSHKTAGRPRKRISEKQRFAQ